MKKLKKISSDSFLCWRLCTSLRVHIEKTFLSSFGFLHMNEKDRTLSWASRLKNIHLRHYCAVSQWPRAGSFFELSFNWSITFLTFFSLYRRITKKEWPRKNEGKTMPAWKWTNWQEESYVVWKEFSSFEIEFDVMSGESGWIKQKRGV